MKEIKSYISKLHYLGLIIMLICALECRKKEPLPPIKKDLFIKLKNYLDENALPAEDYIISKFKEYDIIFLGEFHRIKENVELVQRLIPKLYENGIYILFTEFARWEDQKLIDSLVNLPYYDESLAREITFKQFVFWGYKEYVDIFKVAHELNKKLKKGQRKFRIIGIKCSPDWSYIKKPEDRDNPEIMRKVWGGCSEKNWAEIIIKYAIEKEEKALVYCGMQHSFTSYLQPVVVNGKFIRYTDERVGNHIKKIIGDRTCTIIFHSPWSPYEGYDKPYVYPADGYIDALMHRLSSDYWNIGFDVKNSPFGELPCEKSIYRHGYEGLKLSDLCDGYIFQVPISKYHGVTVIPDWITEENLEYARKQSPNPYFRKADIKDFMEAIKQSADIKKRFKRFH